MAAQTRVHYTSYMRHLFENETRARVFVKKKKQNSQQRDRAFTIFTFQIKNVLVLPMTANELQSSVRKQHRQENNKNQRNDVHSVRV